jgi:Fungal Zn(2)-Cys(6) binuclear cluster domain
VKRETRTWFSLRPIQIREQIADSFFPQCDEVHPICGNCKKRDISCTFATEATRPTPYSTPTLQQSPGTDRQSAGCGAVRNTRLDIPTTILGKPSSPIPLPPQTGALRLAQPLELRLMHHCTAMVHSAL